MPRRDGFSTNRELLAEFNQQARDLLVSTYERQISRVLPPMLEEKPLSMVNLHFRQYYQDEAIAADMEDLVLRIHGHGEVEDLADRSGYRDLSAPMLARYADASRAAEAIVLTDGVDMSPVQPEAVRADYTLTFHTGERSQHISSFMEKPAKASIIAGRTCIEEAQHYVDTRLRSDPDRAQTAPDDGYVRLVMGSFGLTKTIRHWYALDMVPELPLNGYEPPIFLERYRRRMFELAMHEGERVERLRQTDMPQALIELHAQRHHQAMSAYGRADRLLGPASE